MSTNNTRLSFFHRLGHSIGNIFKTEKPKQPVYTEPQFRVVTNPRALEDYLAAQLRPLFNIFDYADSFIDDKEYASEIQEQGFMLHSNSADEAKDYFAPFADFDAEELCSIDLDEFKAFSEGLRQPLTDLAEKVQDEKFRIALDSVLFALEQMPLPTIEVLAGKVQHAQ
ncbi:MAG TPA: hypothetical protein DCS48_11085 [Desulfovibrio sp.]|nr:hypothetical protein [Desulfovibrio sp.]